MTPQPKGVSLQTIKLAGARDQIAKRPSEEFPYRSGEGRLARCDGG
jgi:hypothetical protein